MLKKIPLALIFLIGLAACKSKSAFNYSQNFVKKETSLLPDIKSTEEKVKHYVAVEQYDSIGIAGEKLEKKVDDIINEIKNEPTPDAKEIQNFKDEGIKYFSIIKNIYTCYKNFGYAKTAEARADEMQKLNDLTDKKTQSIKAMQDAQQKFADANGFKLEKANSY